MFSWSCQVYEAGESNWQMGARASVVGHIWSSISRQVKWSVVTVLVKACELVVNDVRVIKVRVRPITGLLVSGLLPKGGGSCRSSSGSLGIALYIAGLVGVCQGKHSHCRGQHDGFK